MGETSALKSESNDEMDSIRNKIIPKDNIKLLRGSLFEFLNSSIRNSKNKLISIPTIDYLCPVRLEKKADGQLIYEIVDNWFSGLDLDNLFLMLGNLDKLFNQTYVDDFIKTDFVLKYDEETQLKTLFIKILNTIKSTCIGMMKIGNPNSLRMANGNLSIQDFHQLSIAYDLLKNSYAIKTKDFKRLKSVIDFAENNIPLDNIGTVSDLGVLNELIKKLQNNLEYYNTELNNEVYTLLEITDGKPPVKCHNPGKVLDFSTFLQHKRASNRLSASPDVMEKYDKALEIAAREDYQVYLVKHKLEEENYTKYTSFYKKFHKEKEARIKGQVSTNARNISILSKRIEVVESRIKELTEANKVIKFKKQYGVSPEKVANS